MKNQSCPNDEFQIQFTTFSNAINELTTFALMNRVPMPISRDISGLNDVIIKCKRDRLRNLDSRNDRPALRSELNVSAIVPLIDGPSDPSIRRGNLRPMGSSLYNSVDHLYEGGNLQQVPMPMRGSLTVLNPLRDITMSVRGEVIDNDGQRSPRYMPNRIDDMNVSRGDIINNVGQRSPRSMLSGTNDVNVFWGGIIDNVGQQSPHSLQTRVDDIRVCRGKVIDNVGHQSPRNETIPRLPEPGAGNSSINLSQSVTQILASLGKDGYINPREGLAVISTYTDTLKETMTARFNNQEERIIGLESQLFISRNAVERYENSLTGFQNEVTRLDDMITPHERTIPKLKREVETSLGKVNSVLNQVEDRMEEFLIWINHIKEYLWIL